jgi:hypothetical protein
MVGNILANSKTITPVEVSYLDGATSNIQTQLSTLQEKTTMISFYAPSLITKLDYNVQLGTSGASSYVSLFSDISANNLTITPVEVSYLDGATSNIQTQITNAQTQVNSLNQKTTAMTYQASPERTTFSNGLVCATLDANNYIFVGGVNIYDIYTPRGLCYTKTESDNRYLGISLQGTIDDILDNIAQIFILIGQIFIELGIIAMRVTDTEDSIDNLVTSVNNLTSSLSTLQTQVNNAVSDITGLENVTQNLTATATGSTFTGNLAVDSGTTTLNNLVINGDNFNNLLQNQW